MRQQPYRIKGGNRKGRKEEQPRHIAHVLRAQPPTQSTEKNDRPEEKANDQENLPESSQVEILKALISKPLPSRESTLNSRNSPACCQKNNRQRYEQAIGKPILPSGSRPTIIGVRKIPAARKEVETQKIAS